MALRDLFDEVGQGLSNLGDTIHNFVAPPIQDFTDWVGKQADQATQTVENAVEPPAQDFVKWAQGVGQAANEGVQRVAQTPASEFFLPTSTPFNDAAANVQKTIQSPEGFQLPKTIRDIPVAGPIAQGVTDSFVNAPLKFGGDIGALAQPQLGTGEGIDYKGAMSPIVKTVFDLEGKGGNANQTLSDVAGAGLDVLSYLLPGEGQAVAQTTLKSGFKEALLQSLKSLPRTATELGAFGGLGGVASDPNDNFQGQAASGAKGFVQSALLAPLFAFGIPVLAKSGSEILRFGKNSIDSPVLQNAAKNDNVFIPQGDITSRSVKDLVSHEGAPDLAKVAQYKQDIASGKPVEPIYIIKEGDKFGIEDGKHRYEAFKQLGFQNIPTLEITRPSSLIGMQPGFVKIPGKDINASEKVVGENGIKETSPNTIEQPQELQSSLSLNQDQKTANPQISVEGNSSGGSVPPPPNTKQYLDELIQNQDQARQGETTGVKAKLGDFYRKLKEELIDTNAPIEDVLNSAEKKGGYQVLPTQDIRMQIDRSLRAPTLAGQFAKDNGLVDVIRQAPDLQALDQYLIAKQATTVAKNGIETGRDLSRDAQLVKDLAPTYEPFAKQVNEYSRKMLDYSVDSGLISKDLAEQLKQKYPEYVPLNRIFNEDELISQPFKGTGKGVASLSKQTVVQKLEGSTREIENPIASLLTKTQTAFEQGERNMAAKQLASYKDLPGNPFNIVPVKEGEAGGKTTFSAMFDGKKQIFQTTPEIAGAAKSLTKEQMGILAKIVSIPTRILRLGATGLNYPFAVANLIKDQASAFINTKNAFATSNPIAFTKGLFAALGHGKLYEDMVRSAAGGTSFDIGRENPNLSVRKIRSSKNIATNVMYKISHPSEYIRTAEDLIGRTEELTRAQQYHGTYDSLLKQGRTPEDAALLAAKAARENTVNFARGGSFSKVLNWIIPYFNAGVQGSRTFVRNVQTRPVQTLAKFAVGVGMPVAAATLWNTSDPARKAAYDDISDFEKQNNIVIVPPNPTKNPDGSWNVLKIPLSQEIASLTALIRRPLEQAAGLDPVKVSEMANALFQTATSLNTGSPTGLMSSLTPQIAKPAVEAITNKNLFTGKDIVPPAYKNLPPDQQVKKGTSGTARIIGKATGMSPLIIQNEASTILGGLGPQILNVSDAALNKAGIIPDNQVGGKSPGAALDKRFFQAQGGDTQQKIDATVMKGLNPKETEAYNLLHAPKQVDEKGNPIQDDSVLNSQQKALLYLNYPKLQEVEIAKAKLDPNHDPIWDLPANQRQLVLAVRTALPNQQSAYKKELQVQPWYGPFQNAESQFFASLPNQTPSDRPQPSAYVQQQMGAKNWSDPQVKAYLDANTAYNNDKLAKVGLPAITNSGFGLSASAYSYGARQVRRIIRKNKSKILKIGKGSKLYVKSAKNTIKSGSPQARVIASAPSGSIKIAPPPKLNIRTAKTPSIIKLAQIQHTRPSFVIGRPSKPTFRIA